jgi:hypothetical protein
MQHRKPWPRAMARLFSMGVPAEQQAPAAHDLKCVIGTYLPVGA